MPEDVFRLRVQLGFLMKLLHSVHLLSRLGDLLSVAEQDVPSVDGQQDAARSLEDRLPPEAAKDAEVKPPAGEHVEKPVVAPGLQAKAADEAGL